MKFLGEGLIGIMFHGWGYINPSRIASVIYEYATDGVNTGYDLMNLQIFETLPVYTLTVTSNVGVEIGGSGEYEELSNATLTAPQTVPMEGVLGVLGGKYVFQRWTGFVNIEQNPVSIIIFSDDKALTMQAIYAQDLTTVYIVLASIILGVLVLSMVILFKRRKKPVQPSPASTSKSE